MQSQNFGQQFTTQKLVVIDEGNVLEVVPEGSTPEETIKNCFYVSRRTIFGVFNLIETFQPIVFAPGGTTHMTSKAARKIDSRLEVVSTLKWNGKEFKESK